MNKVDKITQIVGQKFRSFGGGQENPYNPVSMALSDQPLQFAAGVDIKSVVRTVLYAGGTPVDPQHGREPDKVKPLAQYLDEYLKQELTLEHLNMLYDGGSWRELLEQALDAYESTEQVKIRIEKI